MPWDPMVGAGLGALTMGQQLLSPSPFTPRGPGGVPHPQQQVYSVSPSKGQAPQSLWSGPSFSASPWNWLHGMPSGGLGGAMPGFGFGGALGGSPNPSSLTGSMAGVAPSGLRGGASAVDQLMAGIGMQESGGRYGAVNPRTRAYGKFQIMPGNWGPWAAEAGMPGAPRTAANQEQVARFKMGQYYNYWLPRVGGDTTRAQQLVAAQWYGGMGGAKKYLAGGGRKRFRPNEPSIDEYVKRTMGRI